MSVRNLQALFAPKTIAVIGASERKYSLGGAVWKNCLATGFAGSLLPVNPKYSRLDDRPCYRHIHQLPDNVDLAFVCTPASVNIDVLAELGRKRVKAVVVLSDVSSIPANEKADFEQRMCEAAKPTLMRILGPGFMGLQVPKIGVHASAYAIKAQCGDLAFISQSASVVASMLEWSKSRDIGFSAVVSLGSSVDIDIADVLDFLASDGATRAILLYVEKIEHARKFLSAARAAARAKPVIVVMPRGLHEAGDINDSICENKIYDAVFRRAGMLRVDSMIDLFDAAETLAYARGVYGEQLAIATNGRGLGLLAGDALRAAGGRVASMSHIADIRCYDTDPSDISAITAGYVQSLTPLLQEKRNDCVLLIHSPTSSESVETLVDEIIPIMQHASRPLLTCWMGAESLAVRHKLASAHISVFATPEQAVRGFMHMANYRRNQALLMQVPESLSDGNGNHGSVSASIKAALQWGRSRLADEEAASLLTEYGLRAALSAEIQHGIIIDMQDDAIVGPVVAIGNSSRKLASVVGLPPLNSVLAADMITCSGLHAANGDLSPHQREQIETALIQISRMVSEVAEITNLRIELAFSDDVMLRVANARIDISDISGSASDRLAIRPYPKELEHVIDWQGQPLTIRPIKPEDGAAHIAFFAALTPEDVRFRMFTNLHELQPAQLARMTQIDYDREMALIATRTDDFGANVTLGVVRVISDPDNEQAEFAVTVRSDLKAHGLGSILMREIIDYCRRRGTKEIVGDALANNTRLLNMVANLGFEVTPRVGDDTMMLRLALQ